MSSAILDFELALKAVNGNDNLAKDLLQTLIKQLIDYQVSLRNALQSNDKEQLQQIIHKLNGAMRYVGAPALTEKIAPLDGQISTLSDEILSREIDLVVVKMKQIIELGSYPGIDN